MASRFLNLDTDETLSSNSNDLVPSQKAVKTYADNKQPKTLSTPIVVDETTQTTVEGALGAINTLASSKQDELTTGTGISITSAGVISTDALRNTATGSEALTVLGNVSSNSQAHNIGVDSVSDTYGTAVGYTATAGTAGTAIGTRTSAGNYAVAIGSTNGTSVATEATGSSAIAIGYNAKATANNAIQIGTGVNSSADTVQIKSYQLLNSSGIVPTDRLPIATSASTGIVQPDGTTITISGGVLTATPESVMTGATSSSNGTSGLVPAPTSADYNKYLRGDGTWATGGSGGDYLPISGGTMVPTSGSTDVEIEFDTSASASIKAGANMEVLADGGIKLESYGSDVEIYGYNNVWIEGGRDSENPGDVEMHCANGRLFMKVDAGSGDLDIVNDGEGNVNLAARGGSSYMLVEGASTDVYAHNGAMNLKVMSGSEDLELMNDGEGDLNIAVRGSSANINVETESGGAFIYNGGNVLTTNDVSVMSGATSSTDGASGFVPAPTSADYNKYLKGDGTWAEVSSGSSYVLPPATSNSLGGVKIGSGVLVTSDGTISVASSAYVLPEATTSSLGGVIVGGGMNVTSNGTISVPAMSGATSSTNGTSGLVPTPTSADVSKFLKGDGTWSETPNTTYSAFVGATTSAAGSSGLVPAPTTSDPSKFLKGDGTWAEPSISGVFNTTNLVGGKGISLAEKINYSYIDADTMEVWHFDSSYTGFVNNLAINFSSDGRFDTTNYKFGTASTTTMREAYGNSGYAGNGYGAYVDTFNLTSESKLTIDFWVQLTSGTDGTYNDWAFFNFLNQNPIGIKTYWNASTRIFYVSDIATQELSQSIVCDNVGEWHHVAYTYDGSYDTNTAQSVCYIDGVPVLKQTYARTTTFSITRFNMCYQQVNYRPELHFDEVRIAKKIVFTGDFSDDLMTEEYMYPDPSVEPIYEIKNLAYPAYTTTNLIGGDGISIAEKANPQYIDARTLVLMHFNDDYYEEITGTTPEHYGSETYVTGKFGKAIQIGSGYDIFYGTFELSSTTDYTIDYWCKFTYDSSYFQLGPLRFIRNSEYELQVNQGQWTTLSTFTMTDSLNQFNHFAIQRKNQYYQVYFNGKLLGLNKYLTDTWSKGLPYAFGLTGGDPLDELRISDIARYDGDFTPLEVPYEEPDPDAEKVYEVTNLFKPDTNAYTRDNLVAGVNTSITEYVDPNIITSDVLCVFHFDEAAYNPNNMSFGYNWGYQERMDISVFDSGKSVTGNGLVMDMPNYGADFTYQKQFSADAWLAFNDNMSTSTDSGAVFGFGSNTSGYGWSTGSYFIQAQITKTQIVFSSHNSNSVTVNMPSDWLPDNTFHHVYIPYDGAGNAYLYVDGKKLATLTGVDSGNWTIKSLLVRSANQWMYAAWDEIRVSKNNPWTADFVPPTGVYKEYNPNDPKVYQINSTSGLGKQIGEIFWSQSSSASDNAGGLPLFTGETIINADTRYPEFYTWVETHTELQISAANYETALTTYGECPKYVIDTVNKTIRLPWLKNYIKNANTTDGITQASAGLPNIIGQVGQVGTDVAASDAFYNDGNAGNYDQGAFGFKVAKFDASRYSSTYGNSNTVTPAHTTLYPWVCAYNTAVAASVAQAAEFQQALTGKLDTNFYNITNAGKDAIVNICMPDYANVVTVSGVTAGVYTQVAKDSFVVTYGSDPFMEDYKVYVSPDNGTTKYIVGVRLDDTNAATEGDSYSFFVPKGWYFTNEAENGYGALIYPLKGAQ